MTGEISSKSPTTDSLAAQMGTGMFPNDPANVVETVSVSPQSQKSALFNDFLISPSLSPCEDFDILSSANNSPFTPDLDTPVLNDLSDDFGIYGSEYSRVPLFSDSSLSLYQLLESPELAQEVLSQPFELSSKPDLEPDSVPIPILPPSSPDAASLSPKSLLTSVSSESFAAATVVPPSAKAGKGSRANANGTRKNVTPDSLVPVDAPIQARKYVTPSATSRKEIPVAFIKSQKRKRSRTQAFGDEEAQSQSPYPVGDDTAEEQPPLNATDKEIIEWKRRQNTLAARKSRKRKLEHQQFLETRVKDLETENEMLKVKADALEAALRAHNILLPSVG
ncbi:hypothetical protein F5878DRAFT_612796 [Lentinula raphanica]|uniref:BZIP domain-containing protein n=1 Tax=Lentinula raphanica TaxID=153919 RepID=A0AA38UG56_9AGAR|nr:hypothetical protein F5878DRAFT_612796 [Lentinula raphanica]